MSRVLLLHGHAARLPLADASVHTICTSPPFYGLRQYDGLAPSPWPGGTFTPVPGLAPLTLPGPATWEDLAACAHDWQAYTIPPPGHTDDGQAGSTLQGGKRTQTQTQRTPTVGAVCARCEAVQCCLGNESTLELYLWHLVLVLRELARVLRPDGVLWMNLGDTYFGDSPVRQQSADAFAATWNPAQTRSRGGARRSAARVPGLVPGSLLLVPARVAMAAQAEGWILRQDCVVAKQAAMPESVHGWSWEHPRCRCLSYARGTEAWRADTFSYRPQADHDPENPRDLARPTADPDCLTCGGQGYLDGLTLRRGSWRHTRSHEAMLMLTKDMSYFANSELVREPNVSAGQRHEGRSGGRDGYPTKRGFTHRALHPAGKNPRSVLTPTPTPLRLPHYAAWPPSLIEPLIKATCPERVCVTCREPWAPVVTRQRLLDGTIPVAGAFARPDAPYRHTPNGIGHARYSTAHALHGLAPSCACYCTCDVPYTDALLVNPPACLTCGKLPYSAWDAGMCLDPFGGSGTTALVARALGRHCVSLDASPVYLRMARERLSLEALDAWTHGREAPALVLDGLPLFEGSH